MNEDQLELDNLIKELSPQGQLLVRRYVNIFHKLLDEGQEYAGIALAVVGQEVADVVERKIEEDAKIRSVSSDPGPGADS